MGHGLRPGAKAPDQPPMPYRLRASPRLYHAPARGATWAVAAVRRRAGGFNPRPRAGGDLVTASLPAVSNGFQSTPPRGGRRVSRFPQSTLVSFNPRPRAGGDPKVSTEDDSRVNVSIHAPARGATRLRPPVGGGQQVSIHAPARGATMSPAAATAWKMFQSTPPRGGRQPWLAEADQRVVVSIHAPARGATRGAGDRLMPASPEFQSTPPRGGRLTMPVDSQGYEVVSIHAPARGATGSPDFPLWVW